LSDPIQAANLLLKTPVALSVGGKFTSPAKYQTQLWQVEIDGSQVQVGDFLVQGTDRYVIVEEIPLLPMLALYVPRTVTISRPTAPSGVGAVGYAEPTLTTVATNVPCAIEVKKEVGSQPAKLPGDITRRTYWTVGLFAPLGTVHDRDVLTDDLGQRYQVTADDWTPLGYQLLAERLEA